MSWSSGSVKGVFMLFSKTDERSMKSETNIISCDVPPENPKDHEDMCAGKQYFLCSIALFKLVL